MMGIAGGIGNIVQAIRHFEANLVFLSGTDEGGDIRLPTGKAAMMFADERAVHKQAGMAVDAVETQDRMLAGVIGRDGERLPVGERLVVLDGIALHSRLAGNLYLVPLAIRRIPELPGSTQQDGRRFDTGQFLQDRIGGFIGKPLYLCECFRA